MVIYAVQSIPKPSEASTSADGRPRRTLRNVWSLLQDMANSPALGVSHDVFISRLSALLAAEQAFANAQHERELRFSEFITCVANASSSSFLSAHLDEILAELSSL